MQINRLFEIIYILLNKETVTSKELAERFEVSARTIYRDIDILSAAGIPIYTEKGRNGGISLLHDFVLNKTVLTQEERNDILSSFKAVSAVGADRTDTALKKLGAMFGGGADSWLEIDFSSWADYKKTAETFEIIKSVIINKQVIEFEYFSGSGERTKREAEPLKLCFKGGSWYLYAFCRFRNDFRFFKLTRIINVKIKEEIFSRSVPRKIFKEKNSFNDEFIRLKMRISKKLAYRVYDEFDEYYADKDGSFIAYIMCPKDQWLYYYISTFGKDCEVLEPKEVRSGYKSEIEKILKIYKQE